ncbi:acetyl-CoA carboxylase biotin carboxyl carrier protein [Sphingomonas alba]|uniref:Biotin carboxyl carrier protein of acetyl-CoA carboxylase n=1 Tax=Sphingomonas alba TaxID=2908208 RepID=A0ABT0RKL5_9SPHN|nr:acetyl-CoA carboxylase biotin carboxyl carrier protein [Sphingomonas alba]MCL6683187.1 acetyl-CoA carboxylase biotin carboxyl carrier protein [Sphingomonas alba]
MAAQKPGKPTEGAMRVDTDLIRELADLLTANELTEIQVEDGERKIKVRREAASFVAAPAYHAPAAATAPAPAAEVAAPAAEEISGNAVKSPMVGTAYMSAEPGGAPFVSVGKAVKAGDTLLIVEAMKVMNPITAPSGGTIKQIMVSDGQPVEFDQPLVVIG